MELSVKMSKIVSVIKKYDSSLRKNNNSYKHYFAPNIPEKVVKKLIKCFDSNLAINSLVAFYDSTLFDTSKSGILFTNDGIYHKYIGKAIYFAYKDIHDFYARGGNLDFHVDNSDILDYTIVDVFDMEILKKVLIELKEIDEYYGQSSMKSSGKVKKIDLPPDILKKCNGIIHAASVACGGVGTGLAQLPGSDNAVIVPIQIGMIVGLGSAFELNITESAAKSIIASAGATITGRTVSQFLVGWIPGIGNAINTATAAGVTEAIGWIAVKNFYNRWIQDKNKGRYDGMKAGYSEASDQYEHKLRQQADNFLSQWENVEKYKDGCEKLFDEYDHKLSQQEDDFLSQRKDFKKERDEYENLLQEYEDYIKELEKKCAPYEHIENIKGIYNDLKSLQSN